MADISKANSRDFEDIRRFWYQVYCEHRGVLRHLADHLNKTLDDKLLTHGQVFIARESTGEIVGTVMATYARDTDLGEYEEFYELHRLTSRRGVISIVTKLMTSPSRRGTAIAGDLLKAITRQAVQDGIEYAVYDANPPTDAWFKRMGGREWVGVKFHPSFGEVSVMVTRLKDDRELLRAHGHPLALCFVDQEVSP